MPDRPAGRLYNGLLFSRRVIRFGSQLGFVLIAGILLLIAAYRLTQLWLVPEVTVAVAESDTGYSALFANLRQVSDSKTIKIDTVVLPDAAAVTAALEQGRADFAVIRPDQLLPVNGMTAAILREDAIVILSWATAKIETPEQLSKRRIGIFNPSAGDGMLLDRLLRFYGVKDATLVEINDKTDEIKAAIAAKQIDAIAFVGQPDRLRDLVRSLGDLKPAIVPLNEQNLEAKIPGLGATTIAARSITGKFPEEEIRTASVSFRLVAAKDVERATVSALLQVLFSHRLALARKSDLAWDIKGLGDEGATFSRLPSHRGALDYYNREQQTFMDLYGDWLWLGLFAAGGISSAFAWLVQVLSRRRKQLVESILDRLLEILSEARDAETTAKLDELTLEIDGLVTHAVRQARWRAADPLSTTALTLAIDSTRMAVADQRAALQRSAQVTS